jgi:GrpB-like predicted nucleotidyltransferase (UPF0157 family)
MPTIVPYQSLWSDEFKQIASQIRKGLGILALRIDHIGSTSVPGLASKDVIDIQVTVASMDESLLAAFNTMGYTRVEEISHDHLPPGLSETAADWQKWYLEPPEGDRKCQIHVREQGRANQRYPLLFRDYLRAHPATTDAYAELKRRLATNLADPKTYPDVKDPAVDLIYLAAEEWATANGWVMGPSDG